MQTSTITPSKNALMNAYNIASSYNQDTEQGNEEAYCSASRRKIVHPEEDINSNIASYFAADNSSKIANFPRKNLSGSAILIKLQATSFIKTVFPCGYYPGKFTEF